MRSQSGIVDWLIALSIYFQPIGVFILYAHVISIHAAAKKALLECDLESSMLFEEEFKTRNVMQRDCDLLLYGWKEKLELLKGLSLGRNDKVDHITPLQQEVLIVWGENDQIFLLDKATELKELLGEKARLEVIKNASHVPQLEHGAKFNKIVNDFLCGSDD
ncbi:hypothetical protein HAX54_002197 [Datura stramonium]|uniref:AB hydrolase-1 domain-containing protein n=1 Tax=Datura stramonium TaxID=4076 RepID=A0ABS8RTD9_DATST|nr:hypothetical protein [Datura stramonium]